jgi:diacylglycerol kinase family enzyme
LKIILLHNPKAGYGQYTRAKLYRILHRAGFEPTYHTIRKALANPELLQRGDFVAVAGGDGSVRKAALQLVGTGQRLAPLPLGTANNIASTLGIRGTAEEVVAGWREGTSSTMDMGVAEGPWGRRWFVEGVGIGLVGRTISILREVDRADPTEFNSREDKLRRDLSVFVSLAHDLPPVSIKLKVDGRNASGDFLILEIMNIARAGPGVKMATRADPSDGYLDMVVARSGDRPALLRRLFRCLGHPDHGAILPGRRVRRLRLRIRGGEFRVDDRVILRREDTEGKGVDITVRIEPNALNILLPRGASAG